MFFYSRNLFFVCFIFLFGLPPSAYSEIFPLFEPGFDTNHLSKSFSADGRYLLVGQENQNGNTQIYRYDRFNPSELLLVSANSSGEHPNGSLSSESISSNGRYVVFASNASNLNDNDSNEFWDNFIYDSGENLLQAVSVDTGGNVPRGSGNGRSSVTPNGRFIAFTGSSQLLDPDLQSNCPEGVLFLRDQLSQTTEVISDTPWRCPRGNTASVRISDDGKIVVWKGLNGGGPGNDIWRKNLVTKEEQIISEPRTTLIAQLQVDLKWVSRDGRFIVFDGYSGDYIQTVPWDQTNPLGTRNVFLYDSQTDSIHLISTDLNGDPLPSKLESGFPVYISGAGGSDDGRYMAFSSNYPDIIEEDSHNLDVFIKDMQTGEVKIVSKNPNREHSGDSSHVGITADGASILFRSSNRQLSAEPLAVDQEPYFIAANPFLFSGDLASEYSPRKTEETNETIEPDRKAVVFAHGWNSNAFGDMIEMANQICQELSLPITAGSPNRIGRRCHNEEWDIWYVDWRYTAGDGLSFFSERAWRNARYIGDILGYKFHPYGYTHVHLIAHSAGSQLINQAKNRLFELPKNQRPKIHMTFLDAYDPESWRVEVDGKVYGMSTYGGGANWVDSYVDTRQVVGDIFGLIDTNLIFFNAFNIDVSALDDEISLSGLRSHAWPVDFYKETLQQTSPSSPSFGFGYSLESETFLSDGIDLTTLKTNHNKLCIVDNSNPTNCENGLAYDVANSYAPTTSFRIFLRNLEAGSGFCSDIAGPLATLYPGLQQVKTACGLTKTASSLWGLAIDSTISQALCDSSLIDSVTGNDCFSVQMSAIARPEGVQSSSLATRAVKENAISYDPGPTWVEYDFTTEDDVNNISFDYHFPEGVDGLLSIWVDGEEVRRVDQRYVTGTTHAIRNVFIGDLIPGAHKLGFRLDAYSESIPSSVQVANINFGKSDFELDADKDSIGDSSDNCPAIDNFDQQNTDGDWQGDDCDTDDDNDLAADDWETTHGFDPLNAEDGALDTDSDGYSNLLEFLGGSDPNDAGSIPVFSFSTFTLPSDSWRMMSLPGDPGAQNTVADIFGDYLSPDDYGATWVLYRYIAGQGYLRVELTDTLTPGAGYWVTQVTGAPVAIQMPEGSIPSSAIKPLGCLVDKGCSTNTLATGDTIVWNMVGNATANTVTFDSLRVQTNNGACSEGCSMSEAQAAEYVHNQMWSYPGSGGYNLIESGGSLQPWEGAWLPALTGSGETTPELLVPMN